MAHPVVLFFYPKLRDATAKNGRPVRCIVVHMVSSDVKIWKSWVWGLGDWMHIALKKGHFWPFLTFLDKSPPFEKNQKSEKNKRVGVWWFCTFDPSLKFLAQMVLSVGFRTDARMYGRKVILYPPPGFMTRRGIKNNYIVNVKLRITYFINLRFYCYLIMNDLCMKNKHYEYKYVSCKLENHVQMCVFIYLFIKYFVKSLYMLPLKPLIE